MASLFNWSKMYPSDVNTSGILTTDYFFLDTLTICTIKSNAKEKKKIQKLKYLVASEQENLPRLVYLLHEWYTLHLQLYHWLLYL